MTTVSETAAVANPAPRRPPSVLDELERRGIVAQTTGAADLAAALAAGPLTFYCGFDPTAPSLHIGNLVQILTMRRLQLAGHHPLGLVGGATGLIGDPRMSGERVLNDEDTVAGWVGRIRGQIERYLDFDGPFAARMVNNLDWTAGLSAIEFLRDVGKHFRMGRMLAKETVAARLKSESGLSFTEFSYQILQGMDYLELYRRYGCTLQTGGSDQWGNLISGTELIHKVEGAHVHALATPLITKADGTKFGKTEGGAVWLDPEMTSPYAFYQFWVNADDRDVEGYLRVLSFRPRGRDRRAGGGDRASGPQAREAQRALAGELTALVHGAGRPARRGRRQRGAVRPGRARRGERADAARRAVRGRPDRAGRADADGGRAAAPHRAGVLAVRGAPGRSVRAARTSTTSGSLSPTTCRRRPRCCTARYLVLRRGKRSVVGVLVRQLTPGLTRGADTGADTGSRGRRDQLRTGSPGTGRSRCGAVITAPARRPQGRAARSCPERPRTIFADPGMTSRRPALHHTPAMSAGPRWAADEVV